jgi:hypothetical protein
MLPFFPRCQCSIINSPSPLLTIAVFCIWQVGASGQTWPKKPRNLGQGLKHSITPQ